MSWNGTDITDEALLAEYRRGDEDAFTHLFRRYSRRIFGYVLGLLKDPDAADEVTQKVFVKLSRRPEMFRPTGMFSSWIHRVARNAALDHLKARRDAVPIEDLREQEGSPHRREPGLDDPPDPDRPHEVGTLHDLVAAAIQRLEGVQREALVLREYSELSYREISEITGRSLANVKQDIYQARQTLRSELAPLLGRTMQG